ncbi:MAG TPA: ABC transporter substrate-binding protein [Spirochaetia bacterium]|nr:ABC transporter substrate-binding protein [Spirochaetia bacterium]
MKKSTRRAAVTAAALAVALALAACSSKSTATTTSTDPAKASAAKALTIRYYDNPSGFDPATIFRIENENIAFNIYDGLTTYDSATGKIIPDLAESWSTPDNEVWTFHLRKGVQWQDGYGEFTSADVLYSYNRIMDPATASPYRTEFGNVKSITAPDKYTVVITLNAPDGNFLNQVANYHQGQIVKKEAVEKYGLQYKWHPVGTGPYALQSVDPTSQIVLVRNDKYFGGPAPIQKLVFNIIKDDNTATIALENGEVDLAMSIGSNEDLQKLAKEGFRMNHVDNYAISLFVFNLDNPYTKDVRVRQAFAYALDIPAILKATTPLTTIPANNILPSWMDVYTSDVPAYPYDPQKAKELLKAAGYPNGFKITYLGGSVYGVSDANQLEKEYLSKVGIDLEFKLVDSASYNKMRNDGTFELSGRLLPAVNPDTLLFSYLDPANIAPKGMNGARYNNPVLTKDLHEARAAVDPAKRKELYAEVQKIAMTDLPYLPIDAANVYWPGQQWVTGVVINKLADVDFHGVDIDKKT